MRASTSGSTAEVASSMTSSRGRRTSARASESRCRWPPERVVPRSPSRVSRPSGRAATKPSAWAVRSASHTVVVGHVGAERDVAAHGVVEQERLLRHQRGVLGQRAGGQVAQVGAVDEHLPLVGVDQPQQQRGQRALAAGGGADHGDRAARLDREREVVEQRRPVGVAVAQVGVRRAGHRSRPRRATRSPYAISPVASRTACTRSKPTTLRGNSPTSQPSERIGNDTIVSR